jgi:hypothetical protein
MHGPTLRRSVGFNGIADRADQAGSAQPRSLATAPLRPGRVSPPETGCLVACLDWVFVFRLPCAAGDRARRAASVQARHRLSAQALDAICSACA